MGKLGDLERDVMTRLWASPEALTVREVHDQISGQRDIAYTTVMTVLDRLAKKGVARQVRDGRAYRYTPAAAREQLVADLMHEALADAGDGADRAAALVRFVDEATPDETAALRDALAALEARTPDRPSGSGGKPARGRR